jgi:hypothetical protein
MHYQLQLPYQDQQSNILLVAEERKFKDRPTWLLLLTVFSLVLASLILSPYLANAIREHSVEDELFLSFYSMIVFILGHVLYLASWNSPAGSNARLTAIWFIGIGGLGSTITFFYWGHFIHYVGWRLAIALNITGVIFGITTFLLVIYGLRPQAQISGFRIVGQLDSRAPLMYI